MALLPEKKFSGFFCANEQEARTSMSTSEQKSCHTELVSVSPTSFDIKQDAEHRTLNYKFVHLTLQHDVTIQPLSH